MLRHSGFLVGRTTINVAIKIGSVLAQLNYGQAANKIQEEFLILHSMELNLIVIIVIFVYRG